VTSTPRDGTEERRGFESRAGDHPWHTTSWTLSRSHSRAGHADRAAARRERRVLARRPRSRKQKSRDGFPSAADLPRRRGGAGAR